MIGRAAQGRPWIFREIDYFLTTGKVLAAPTWIEMRDLLLEHLADHYQFYGEQTGVRTARKHIGWYVSSLDGGQTFSDQINRIETTTEQFKAVELWFSRQGSISPDMAPTNCDNLAGIMPSLQAA